jgi:hypothetical protein
LGAAVGSNIARLAGFSHHVRVVDLLGPDGPGRRLAELEADGLTGAAGTALPSEWGRFDLVLAWDVLIHIGELPARALVERIGALCEPGACLFVMVATTDDMPERPIEYRILDDETLQYRSAATGRRPNPKWPPSLVERLLRGWRIDCSFVLRHGIQEYVAIRQ